MSATTSTASPNTNLGWVALTAGECPSANACKSLPDCSNNMQVGDLCEADSTLPNGDRNFNINNCGSYDVFRYTNLSCQLDIDLGNSVSITSAKVNGQCVRSLTVNEGDSVNVELNYLNSESQCPGCVEQIYVGIGGIGQRLNCIYNGNPRDHDYDSYTLPLRNLRPGTYKIVADASWQYSCQHKTDGHEIATVTVLSSGRRNLEDEDEDSFPNLDEFFDDGRLLRMFN